MKGIMVINNSYILLPHMRFHAHHGVMEQERVVGCTFTVSLEVKVRFDKALSDDKLENTISYADIHAAVKEEIKITSSLLEHVAGRIAKRLFLDFPSIESLRIEVMKQKPPMGADIKEAGVRIEAERDSPVL